MKKTTTLKEKVALVWTIPLVAIVVVAFALITAILYLSLYLMNITGTTGAALYIFDKVRLTLTDII